MRLTFALHLNVSDARTVTFSETRVLLRCYGNYKELRTVKKQFDFGGVL